MVPIDEIVTKFLSQQNRHTADNFCTTRINSLNTSYLEKRYKKPLLVKVIRN